MLWHEDKSDDITHKSHDLTGALRGWRGGGEQGKRLLLLAV